MSCRHIWLKMTRRGWSPRNHDAYPPLTPIATTARGPIGTTFTGAGFFRINSISCSLVRMGALTPHPKNEQLPMEPNQA